MNLFYKASLFSVIFLGACMGSQDGEPNTASPSVQKVDFGGDIERGQKLWIEKSCHVCHGTSIKQGTSPIDPVNLKDTNIEKLVDYISDTMPKAYGPESCIGQCANDTAQFMMSWVNGNAGSKDPLEVGDTLACAEQETFRRPSLIRLSPMEYALSLRDLLGLKSLPDMSEFPKEELADGFLYAKSVVTAQSEAYRNTASAVAADIVENFEAKTGCTDNDTTCVKNYYLDLAERAFRAPLSDALQQNLNQIFTDVSTENNAKVGTVAIVEIILQSPFFLYRSAEPIGMGVSGNAADQFINASRLSYLVSGSIPDDKLWADAKAGNLDKNALAQHANRLLNIESNQTYLSREFLARWLKVKNVPAARNDLPLDTRKKYINDALTFIKLTSWGANNGLEKLITKASQGDSTNGVLVDDNERIGILTQPAWMVNYGFADRTRPIGRGVFFAENLLCREVPQFNGDVEFPKPQKGLSVRDRLEIHREDPVCASCHALFDPMGVAFEKYDQFGDTRERDEGKLIDASGDFMTGTDPYSFNDARDLLNFVADTEELRYCAMKNWMAYAYRIEVPKELSCEQKALISSLEGSEGIEKMIVETILKNDFFRGI